jgi:hypothetical protein
MPYPDTFSPTAFDAAWGRDAKPEFDQRVALAPELLTVQQLVALAIRTLDEQAAKIARHDVETARETGELSAMLRAALRDHFEQGVVAIARRRHEEEPCR